MLDIVAEGKKYLLSNEQVIIVKRVSVIGYYLLIASLLIYKKALISICGASKINKIDKYIKYIKEHALDVAKTKIEFDKIKELIKDSVENINIDNQKHEIVIEILNKVLEFNSVSFGLGGKEFETLEELNEDLEIKVGLISLLLKKTPSDVLKMPNYELSILLREHNRNRVNMINDHRLAQHADRQDYIKYTKGLMGYKVYTGEEIQKDPSILKGVVH